MAQAPSTQTERTPLDILRQRSPVFAAIGGVDDAIYRAERSLVTSAMLVMSGVVCLNILDQFLTAQRVAMRAVSAGDATVASLWPMLAALIVTVGLAKAGWAASDMGKDNPGFSWIMAGVTSLSVACLCALVLFAPSHLVVALLVLTFGVWTAQAQLDRPLPLDHPAPARVAWRRAALALAFALAGAVLAFRVIPEGYTWAQRLALFLLLWVAFIGASMATHDGSHLTIDAARKAMPQRFLGVYEAASAFVAAAFTLAFLYLSVRYFQDRLVENTAPGEIPDWLKVLSLPVALSLVSGRFLLRGVASLLAGSEAASEPHAEATA